MIAAVSLVDVSVSIDTALNVRSMTLRNAASRSVGATPASVQNSAMSVAMSGSIIPTPLAMPTTVAGPTEDTAILGTVSGVMMARAHASADVFVNGHDSFVRWALTWPIGYARPMTPVDAMSTSLGRAPTA